MCIEGCAHPYLLSRGFDEATIAHFGLGLAKKGLMKERIAIPLHNFAGELVGYAGRIVDDERIGVQCPRYLFPSDREKDGVRYVFRKSELLCNGHCVKALARRGVIIVECNMVVAPGRLSECRGGHGKLNVRGASNASDG
jgi:DNA primase